MRELDTGPDHVCDGHHYWGPDDELLWRPCSVCSETARRLGREIAERMGKGEGKEG